MEITMKCKAVITILLFVCMHTRHSNISLDVKLPSVWNANLSDKCPPVPPAAELSDKHFAHVRSYMWNLSR